MPCRVICEYGRRFQEIGRALSTEVQKKIGLEIAHVLFLDIVGYSKVSLNEEQHARIEETESDC